jgi:hypothetical protein
MSKRQFSQRERRIATGLVVVIALALIYRAAYVPLKEKSADIKGRIETGQKQLTKNMKVLRKAQRYEKEHQTLLENFKQKGSDAQTMSALITEIESVAGQVNIRIADLKPQKVRKVDAFNSFSVSLILDGELTPIMNFVYNLQNQPHLFAVDELRLDKKSPNSQDLKGYLILSRILLQP